MVLGNLLKITVSCISKENKHQLSGETGLLD